MKLANSFSSMAVVSNNMGSSDVSKDFFTSLSRFSDIIPLHIGIGRTAFTAVDRSLGNHRVVIKTLVCVEDLSQQLLSHIATVRKLCHQNIAGIHDAFLINEYSDGGEGRLLERLCIVQVGTGLRLTKFAILCMRLLQLRFMLDCCL